MTDGCEMVLENSKAVELMAKEQPELHKTICEWLADFIADLKAAFTGVEAKHTESKAMSKYMDELTKLWDLGLVEASRGAVESGNIAFSDRIKPNMSEQERYEILKDGKIAVTEDRNSKNYKGSIEELEKLEDKAKSSAEKIIYPLAQELKILNKALRTPELDIEFTFAKNNGLKESLNKQLRFGGSYLSFAKALINLEDILSNAVLIEKHTDKYAGTQRESKNLIDVAVLFGVLNVGKFYVPVQFEVKRQIQGGNKLYLAVTITEIIKNTGVTGSDSGKPRNQTLLPVLEDSLAYYFAEINSEEDANFIKYIPDGFLSAEQKEIKKYALEADKKRIADIPKKAQTGEGVKRSSREADSVGNSLSEQQQEYFKDSKVRDEGGQLRVMYRGGKGEFTVFDRKKSKPSNLYGRGFYFTDSESHAKQYGNARSFYLNITNRVSTKETTITRAQMKKFLEAVAKNEDDYSFENYGYGATVASVLKSVYGKSDFAMLYDVSQTAIGDMVEAVELFNSINGTHFDGLILDTETVTFSSEQAKLTDNTSPTDNPDIRFSSRDGEYNPVRELLAKRELDGLSERLGGHFPLSAKFDSAMRADDTPLVISTVKAGSVVAANGKIFKAAKDTFRTHYGKKTTIHIGQLNIDANLYQQIAEESISKTPNKQDPQSTLDVIPHLKEIMENSVLMAVERLAHTDNKGTGLLGLRMYNFYRYQTENKKSLHCLVSTIVQDTESAEGHIFRTIENVTPDRGLLGNLAEADMSSPSSGDAYTVAQLYNVVKKISRENGGLKYTSEEKSRYKFPYTQRNDGTDYSSRTDSVPMTAEEAREQQKAVKVLLSRSQQQKSTVYQAALSSVEWANL